MLQSVGSEVEELEGAGSGIPGFLVAEVLAKFFLVDLFKLLHFPLSRDWEVEGFWAFYSHGYL